MFRAAPLRVRVPATAANLGPAFDAAGLALALYDDIVVQVSESGLDVQVAGEGADTVQAGERHLVVKAMRAAFKQLGGQPRGLALRCANRIPHGRGLGSSAAAIVSGVVAARALVVGGSDRMDDLAVLRLACRLEGHPDNVAACLLGGFTLAWTDSDGVRAVSSAVAARDRPGGARADDVGVHREGAADAARAGAVRGRRVRCRPGGAAQRGDHQPAGPAHGCHAGPAAPAVPGLGDASVGRAGPAAARPGRARGGVRGRPDGPGAGRPGDGRPGRRRGPRNLVHRTCSPWTPVVPRSCRWSSDAAVLRRAGHGAAGHDRATHLVGGRYRSAEVLLWASHQVPDGPVLQRIPLGRPNPSAYPSGSRDVRARLRSTWVHVRIPLP